MFARALQERGRKVAILSRGYKSKAPPLWQKWWFWLNHTEEAPPRVVSNGEKVLLDSEVAGDEPFMLARNLPGVVVLVDKNRVKAGAFAISRFGCDTLVGFQYLPLRAGSTCCWWTRPTRSATASCCRAASCASRSSTAARLLRFPDQVEGRARHRAGGHDPAVQPRRGNHRVRAQAAIPAAHRQRRAPAALGPGRAAHRGVQRHCRAGELRGVPARDGRQARLHPQVPRPLPVHARGPGDPSSARRRTRASSS